MFDARFVHLHLNSYNALRAEIRIDYVSGFQLKSMTLRLRTASLQHGPGEFRNGFHGSVVFFLSICNIFFHFFWMSIKGQIDSRFSPSFPFSKLKCHTLNILLDLFSSFILVQTQSDFRTINQHFKVLLQLSPGKCNSTIIV